MEEEQKEEKKPKGQPKKYRWLRRIARVFLGILIFLLLLVLFVRSEWGQNLIVQKTVNYVSDKTGTKVEIDKMYVTFDGDIMLKGLYLEDQKGDTLVYSKSLEADVPLWQVISGNGIGIDNLDIYGLRANIYRKDTISGYNFQFLLDAFASSDSTSVKKDSVSSAMNIVVGDVSLENIDLNYDDAVLGIDSKFTVGSLALSMKKTDIENMDFRAGDIKITNTRIKYFEKPVPVDPNAEPLPLPFLAAESITLNNVFIDYQSYGDRIAANLDLKDVYLELKKADLVNNDIEIGQFDLKKSIIKIQTQTQNNAVTETAVEVVKEAKKDIDAFEWPTYRFTAEEINFTENNISYLVGKAKPTKGVFNPDAIVLTDYNMLMHDVFLKDKNAGLTIESSSFSEASGLNLKELSLVAKATDTNFKITDLNTALNKNKIEGNLLLEYPALSALVNNPEKSKIELDIPNYTFDLNEVFQFQPSLRNNPYINKLSKKLLSGTVAASGYLSNIRLSNARINWGNTTQIVARGNIQNATNPDNLRYDFPMFSARSRRSDIRQFVSEKDLSITLPETLALTGRISGNTTQIDTKALLKTSQGIATVDGSFKFGNKIVFDADIAVKQYQLNKLLNNDQLGSLSLSIDAEGSGNTINDLNANVKANISSFKFRNYEIKDLAIKGDIANGSGNIISEYKDENLNIDLKANVVLDSIATEAIVDLNVIGADLEALGLLQRDVRAGLKLHAEFKGDATNYDVTGNIADGVVVYDNRTYLLGNLNATAHVRKDTTALYVKNKLIDLNLQSNTDPLSFANALQDHIYSYFYRDAVLPDTIKNPVNLKVRGKISQAPILNEVFLVNLKDLDTINVALDFNQKARKLKANITAPHINYSDIEIDSLAFTMDTDKEKFFFDLGFNEINAGPIAIPRTEISGNQINNELFLDFIAYDGEEKMIQIKSQITGNRDRLRWHINPSDLIIQKNPWNTPQENEMIITEKKLEFNNFRFSRNNQSVEITDKLPLDKDHVGIDFENFELSALLNYLNPEEVLAKGNLNGRFVIEDLFGNTGILADLDIRKLNILNTDLGKLSIDAKSKGGTRYDFNASMKGGKIDFDLTGDYFASADGAKIDLDLDLNRFEMTALEGFSQGALSNTKGSFNGKFTLNGLIAEPEYQGNLNFDNAGFEVTALNASFTLANENLIIDNSGFYMEAFTVRDESGNPLVFTGKVGTESFINPTFDLSIKADNFQILNASEDDNNFVYGKASFDADAELTGDLDIPILDMTVNVSDNTDVTYVLPSAAVNIEERDGVVVFVNRENPDAILTRTEEESSTLTGFDISALIKIGKAAKITIIIDEETGDNFQVYGEGDFNFTMQPNGRMNLAGAYDINGGHYEMNLYNLVSRRFELAPSSRVSWSGDPFDAKLDVRAIYRLETSASGLMAVNSNSSPSEKQRYRQVLPFLVYLNVDGELTAPKISFSLDMPEDEQGAIGGQVYGQLQQVNSQEGELNRQVFSLLVLNRFYPESGSDGSRGGVASIARDNLNDALSDQLNVFSDKLLGDTGVELDFGLDSYTDYQGGTPQERTQLDIAAQKKLFNDRLIVRVGSDIDVQGSSSTGEATPLIGNVSLEYLLTQNGRYRLKGFRKNEFENVIDGQTIVSGIALIFTQEFNKFDELWDALLRSETKKAREEEAAALQKIKDEEERNKQELEDKKQGKTEEK